MPRKLLDDCFVHDRDRLRHAEALALIRDRLRPVAETERVPLAQAAGRIAAAPVVAAEAIPHADNAAVDGFAFAHADYLSSGGRLALGRRIAAGHPASGPIAPGSADRIFTGALMPAGADTVAMQEDCAVEGDTVTVPPGLKPGANRRRAGEDLKPGDMLIEPGTHLRPQEIAAAASVGVTHLQCHRPLRIVVFSSGDELRRPGEEAGRAEVYDSNHYLLSALLEPLPVIVEDGGILRDRAASVEAALADAASRADAIISSGGASRGEEDHFVNALDRLGKRHLWQLAVKPGRPMSFGQIGDCVVLGLPGNPVAAFVCFLLYVRPALSLLGGGRWREPQRFSLPAGFEVAKKKPDRREFYRGRLARHGETLVAEKFERDGSGLISSLREADGLIEIPEETTSIARGDMVAFIPFSGFGILR
ncbi:MAG: gephyrin-like molybdotransferase Glp [Flavobacteriaceae bacterium]